MGIAPIPALGPSKDRSQAYESDIASNTRRRGPLRFEEGIATDSDVPNDFRKGAYVDTSRPKPVTEWKGSAETMRERTHMGSSTWIEAPSLLGEFVTGAHNQGLGYEREMGSEGRSARPNRARVTD